MNCPFILKCMIVIVFWALAATFLIASFNEVRESAEIKCTHDQMMGIILSQELRVCDEVQTPNCHHKVKAKYCLVPPTKENK
jgi:ascorbate-specific PTS system EIIC-type component UlaA